MTTAMYRRRRAAVFGGLLVLVLAAVCSMTIASARNAEARTCEVLREHAGTSAVLGSPVVPWFNDADSVQRRIDLMDLVDPPSSSEESWSMWRAHLERAHTDLKNQSTETRGMVWFPASPAIVRAGNDVTAVYAACV